MQDLHNKEMLHKVVEAENSRQENSIVVGNNAKSQSNINLIRSSQAKTTVFIDNVENDTATLKTN